MIEASLVRPDGSVHYFVVQEPPPETLVDDGASEGIAQGIEPSVWKQLLDARLKIKRGGTPYKLGHVCRQNRVYYYRDR